MKKSAIMIIFGVLHFAIWNLLDDLEFSKFSVEAKASGPITSIALRKVYEEDDDDEDNKGSDGVSSSAAIDIPGAALRVPVPEGPGFGCKPIPCGPYDADICLGLTNWKDCTCGDDGLCSTGSRLTANKKYPQQELGEGETVIVTEE